MEYREENNYPKAFIATGIIMTVLIAACYFIVFKNPPVEENGTGGILVNYGTVNEGMGDDYMSTEEPSVAEKANHTKPDKVTESKPTEEKPTPESSEKTVVTQNNEDAPEVAAPTKKPSQNVAPTPPVKTPPAKPTVNQNALYKGKASTGTGEGDGTGKTPGNQGKTTGTTLTNNYNGTGSGNGGNLNLNQRSFVSKPHVDDGNRFEGKIVVDIQVDKAGNVISAKAGRGTTITDFNLIQKCENAVKAARISSLDTAPDTQEGSVVFVFKLN